MARFTRLTRLDAHHRLYLAIGVGSFIAFLVWTISENHINPTTLAVYAWLAFASTELLLSWLIILWSHPRDMHKQSGLQDSSRIFIIIFILVGAFLSLFTIVQLGREKQMEQPASVILAMITVFCSWALVHTVFALRYAHIFYMRRPQEEKPMGGLDFPGETEPNYADFAYFSFVLGMASQVSDVQVNSRRVRKLVLAHSVLSFFFNTTIIALSINIISSAFSSQS